MTYAHRSEIYDADSHMMETPNWIEEYADSKIRPFLEPFVGGKKETLKEIEIAINNFKRRQTDPKLAHKASQEFMSMKHKGWNGLGAFDKQERRLANDLLGFKGQIVFPTSAFNQVIEAKDKPILVGGIKALNRGLAEFCEGDKRLFGAAYIPLGLGPQIAMDFLKEAIKKKFTVILIDTVAPKHCISFTHPDYDKIWAFIQESELATTLHVGVDGGYSPVPRSFYKNASSVPTHTEGDAPRDALAYMAIQYNAELFLSAMIFDGVLERFPKLKIGVIELGASWIISWMKHLDQSYKAFRNLQDLSKLKLLPSEYVLRQVKVTPFAGEDIGWILNSGGEELLMFASDYPHHEGTDDPIGRFEKTMKEVNEVARNKFYAENFKTFLGNHLGT
ncbi:MAG: amidohydrolase family protein [Pseudomonadota bacterium]|nr:amidohydrolase family protein [Pseudomonadota bacterium]